LRHNIITSCRKPLINRTPDYFLSANREIGSDESYLISPSSRCHDGTVDTAEDS
jgi:hypothetical protein